MNSATCDAVIDKANFRNAAQVELATLNAVIPDSADSAARWSLAGDD
jgi:hypothetical protein